MNPDSNKFESLLRQAPTFGAAKVTDAAQQLSAALQGEIDMLTIKALGEVERVNTTLVRPNGQPVPATWTQFQTGEIVVIKNYTFKVAYIGETAILFEPVGPP